MKPTTRAMVDVGRACQLRCSMCYYLNDKFEGMDDLDTLKTKIRAACDRGCDYIDFTGGEPTLNKHLGDAIDYLHSLGMQCCVITNSQRGAEYFEALIEKHMPDDFLLSIHGTPEIHDSIVNKEGAYANIESVLGLFQRNGQRYRTNTVILRKNQEVLADVASTLKILTNKPRICNFINFNPHGSWTRDPKTIDDFRSKMADLSVVRGTLSEAITTLSAENIGVNVRYYPYCRIDPRYRSTICNDIHVMFDPYEWDYEITPRTIQRYLQWGWDTSNNIESKDGECAKCDMRFQCGGINRAFDSISKVMEHPEYSPVSAIKDSEWSTLDPFAIRKHNHLTL